MHANTYKAQWDVILLEKGHAVSRYPQQCMDVGGVIGDNRGGYL